MLRVCIWGLLIASLISIFSFNYELTSPPCGFGIAPKANHGFPIQYAIGFRTKIVHKDPNLVCTLGVLLDESPLLKFQFEFIPGIGVFPILFLANTLCYFVVSGPVIFVLQKKLLKTKR